MSVYYYNGNPIVAPFSIFSNEPVFASDTVSLKQVRASQGVQRWELSFTVRTSGNAVDAFLGSIDEIDATGTMIMPQLKEVDDARTLPAGQTLSVSSSAVAGASSVVVSGPAANYLLPKGSFIKFSNHNKVYVTKNAFDMNIDNTNVTLNIYPSLVEPVVSGSTIKYGAACTLTYYRVVEDAKGIIFQDGIIANLGNINLIEAL